MDLGRSINLSAIGIVRNLIIDPRDDCWGGVESTIELDSRRFTPESLLGLQDFSHIEVIYFMHKVPETSVPFGARHPRNDPALPAIGILAQRPKARPNRIGLSRCALLGYQGLTLRVCELDAIDSTPVLDIKPYFSEFGPRGDQLQPSWVSNILSAYYRSVQWD